ncbi:hypothetical protein JXA85_02890 [Candidatus Woesearchaeota archaeon]|nr:hypothetical protein [Candidatus Woesearchaeota archaeon]
MGIIGTIKKIFSSKEPELEEVKKSDLEEWFNKKYLWQIEKINSEIKKHSASFSQEKKKALLLLDELEKAELHNKKISKREIDIMEGNRASYIKKIRLFLSLVEMPEDVSLLDDFEHSFDSMLDDLNKTTMKSFYVLQQFFANEAARVAASVKKMDDISKNIARDSLGDFLEIENLFKEIKVMEARRKIISKDIAAYKKEAKQLNSELSSLKRQHAERKESENYKNANSLIEEKESVVSKLEELKSSFTEKFAILDKALKKYEHMSLDTKLIKSYLDNPVLALSFDSDFRIIEILSKLKDNIQKLQLKENVARKTKEIISNLSKDYLEETLANYNSLVDKLSELDTSINSNACLNETEGLSKKIKSAEESIAFLDSQISSMQKELSSIKSEPRFEEIVGKISALGFNMRIL